MEINQVRLSRKEFEASRMCYPSNQVIIKMPPKEELTTSSGIVIGFNEDTLYAEGTESHIADVACVHGTITKQVDRLYFNRKNVEITMSWECDIDTLVGDIVWTHPLAAKNCEEILVDDDVYKVLRYEDLFVARRGDTVIPLNGYCVLEILTEERLSKLDLLPKGVDKTKAIVKWNGKDNKRYFDKKKADIADLKEGDIVMIDKKTYVFYLERSKYNAHFDGNQYFVVQKSDLEFVL